MKRKNKSELFHVFPGWEPGHVIHLYKEFGPCWCGALPDKQEPRIIVHKEGRKI